MRSGARTLVRLFVLSGLGGLFMMPGIAHAHGLITVEGKPVEKVGVESRLCAHDDECDVLRLRRITGPSARLSSRNGVIADSGGTRAASLLDLDFNTMMPVGTMHAEFNAYVLSDGAERFQLLLGELDSLFLCTQPDGKVAWPVVGALESRCRPDAALGLGLALPRLQYDAGSGRIASRWAALTGVYNFLRNGHGRGYLQKNIGLTFGVDLETIWFGDLASRSDVGRPRDVNLRGIVGLSGVVRSANAGWELRGDLAARPMLSGSAPALSDWVAEGTLGLSRHFLLSNEFRGEVGLTAAMSWADRPELHPGAFADYGRPLSAFVGVHLGVSYDILLE